jgi:hypothetical protein
MGEDAFSKHAKKIGSERVACCPLCPSPANIRPDERTPAAQHHCYTDCPQTRLELEELIRDIKTFQSPHYRTTKILETHLKQANTSEISLRTIILGSEDIPLSELIQKFADGPPNNGHRVADENNIVAQQLRMQQHFVGRYVIQQDDIKNKNMLNGRRRSKRLRNKRRARSDKDIGTGLDTLRKNSSKLLTKLLNPNYWSRESNYAINRWVTKINNKVRKHIIAMSQPSLAELINPKDNIPLNDNVVGQVFVIHFKQNEGFWARFKGKRRVRVIDYHHRSNSFTVDTTRLDVCEINKEWYSLEIDLNQELRIGSLTHIPRNEVVQLPRDIAKVSKGIYFDSNVIGRSVNLIVEGNSESNEYVTFTVSDYNQSTDQHSLSNESGTRQASLNQLYQKGSIEEGSISFFKEALCHIASNPPKVPHGIHSSGYAARPMPRGKAN